jgi:hypothetical protein
MTPTFLITVSSAEKERKERERRKEEVGNKWLERESLFCF